jgi:hypothetical protein
MASARWMKIEEAGMTEGHMTRGIDLAEGYRIDGKQSMIDRKGWMQM